jgi:hypothetical protein
LSTYETGIATELHPEYLQAQNVKRWSTKIIRNNWSYSRNLSINFSYTKADGAIHFKEMGCSISGVHKLYDVIYFNWNYSFNRKTITDLDTNLNTSFKAKLLYTI